MLVGIDVGDAGMAALEMQAAGRDNALEQMQRRARRANARYRRIGWGENCPRDLVLKVRGLAIAGKARARVLHRTLDGERLRESAGYPARCTGDERPFKKDPATQNSIAGCRTTNRWRARQTRSLFGHWPSPLPSCSKTGQGNEGQRPGSPPITS